MDESQLIAAAESRASVTKTTNDKRDYAKPAVRKKKLMDDACANDIFVKREKIPAFACEMYPQYRPMQEEGGAWLNGASPRERMFVCSTLLPHDSELSCMSLHQVVQSVRHVDLKWPVMREFQFEFRGAIHIYIPQYPTPAQVKLMDRMRHVLTVETLKRKIVFNRHLGRAFTSKQVEFETMSLWQQPSNNILIVPAAWFLNMYGHDLMRDTIHGSLIKWPPCNDTLPTDSSSNHCSITQDLFFKRNLRNEPVDQFVVCQAMIDAIRRIHHSMHVISCGLGKTTMSICAWALMNDTTGLRLAYGASSSCPLWSAPHRPPRVLFITNAVLVPQVAREFQNVFVSIRVGIYMGARRCKIEQTDAVVASITTLTSASLDESFYNAFGLVIIDECHQHLAPTWYAFHNRLAIPRKMALTATPRRVATGTSFALEWIFGPIVQTVIRPPVDSTVVVVRYNMGPQIRHRSLYIANSTDINRIMDDLTFDMLRNKLVLHLLFTSQITSRHDQVGGVESCAQYLSENNNRRAFDTWPQAPDCDFASVASWSELKGAKTTCLKFEDDAMATRRRTAIVFSSRVEHLLLLQMMYATMACAHFNSVEKETDTDPYIMVRSFKTVIMIVRRSCFDKKMAIPQPKCHASDVITKWSLDRQEESLAPSKKRVKTKEGEGAIASDKIKHAKKQGDDKDDDDDDDDDDRGDIFMTRCFEWLGIDVAVMRACNDIVAELSIGLFVGAGRSTPVGKVVKSDNERALESDVCFCNVQLAAIGLDRAEIDTIVEAMPIPDPEQAEGRGERVSEGGHTLLKIQLYEPWGTYDKIEAQHARFHQLKDRRRVLYDVNCTSK